MASGTNIIGILTYHEIDLRVEWHSASFTPFKLFLKRKKILVFNKIRILKHHLKIPYITSFINSSVVLSRKR